MYSTNWLEKQRVENKILTKTVFKKAVGSSLLRQSFQELVWQTYFLKLLLENQYPHKTNKQTLLQMILVFQKL